MTSASKIWSDLVGKLDLLLSEVEHTAETLCTRISLNFGHCPVASDWDDRLQAEIWNNGPSVGYLQACYTAKSATMVKSVEKLLARRERYGVGLRRKVVLNSFAMSQRPGRE